MIVRKSVLSYLVLTLAICAQLGAQGDTVTLLDEVYVKGPKLLLSDIADIRGENVARLADIEVAPAAQPGALRRVNAAFVRSRMRAAGIDEEIVDVVGARQVTAKTMYLDVTRDMIADDLRRFIEREMPWDHDDTIIEIARPPQDYVVPDGVVEFRWRPNPQYGYLGTGSIRGELLVDGQVEKTFYTRATVQTYGEVVVAATDLRRGDVLSHRTLRLEKHDLTKLGRGAFFNIADLEGQLAKSSILEGQVVTNRRVMPPTLVERNQVVVVETRVGALTIQTRAKVQEDGIEGEMVRCINMNSKEEFMGRVGADGTVHVR